MGKGDKRGIAHRSDASTNLVGKFTQSVRRIVQDVKDEGTSSGQTKEEVIETNERLRVVRIRLDGSYETAKRALVELMCKYTDSKQVRNVFQRYNLLKVMIKDVIKLETQYWTLVDIPRQEKQETVPAFVLRACSIMEKTHKSGEGVKTSARLAEEAETKRERIERLERGVQQLEGVPNVSTLHDTEGHDKGHNAQPGLYGGLSRGGPSIAARPPPPFATHDLVNSSRSPRGRR
ncbi:uncharacterized protein LOC116851837 isoform X2 [Odontomachus brunneus]|uniref:uncharacterized protein LOC116851837 isoform X2 n=1 Tax=Odontomachus brunneus TaxID=486640 RepID=UPI0013F1FB7D|nr:uncharacterized protein LOC116851837 isoform X2 [Odontomachus brunneus]